MIWAPIVIVIAVFQILVLHQPFPELVSVLGGLGLVIVGLALFVGIAIVVGVLRILRGWSLPIIVVCGYMLVMLMTLFAPKEIVGLAYDLGGVTTSTVTVPLVTALGVGLARTIRGRNPLTDGFGLIALASLAPMIFVMGYGFFAY